MAALKRSQRGQNLVETALLVPIFFLLLASVVDIGRAFNNYMILVNSVRVGARVAQRIPCESANSAFYRSRIVAAVLEESQALGLNPALAAGQVDIVPNASCPTQGAQLSIRATYPVSTWVARMYGRNTITLQPDIKVAIYNNP